MASELRHETLVETVADGTQTSNAGTEFRNDSSAMIHIRGMHGTCRLTTAANDESARVEVTKAPTSQMTTNNSPFASYSLAEIGVTGGTTGAALDDVTVTAQFSIRWGRGQLTLEPNESLFSAVVKTSGGIFRYLITLEYEFA